MQVYYELLNGETLCFTHAVKAVMENNEVVTGYVDSVSPDPYDSMAGMVSPCCKCFPEIPEELEKIIFDFLRAGKKVMAIKAYIDATGTDLRSVKVAIDEYQDRLDEEEDEI